MRRLTTQRRNPLDGLRLLHSVLTLCPGVCRNDVSHVRWEWSIRHDSEMTTQLQSIFPSMLLSVRIHLHHHLCLCHFSPLLLFLMSLNPCRNLTT